MPSVSPVARISAVASALVLIAMPATISAATPGPTALADVASLITAPPPGHGIAMTAITVTGEGLEIILETDRAGVTRVVDHETLQGRALALDGVAASPGPCRDSTYALVGYRWTRPWAWRFQAPSTPTGMSRASAEAQLRSAVRTITTARNDCGIPDRVRARARYLGRTELRPGIRGDASCGRRDGHSVVGFGPLPPFIAGLTCTTYTIPSNGRGQAIESDVLLNKRHHRWALRRASCAGGEVILRSIATHEFGHVFGLGHVPEASHGKLTMSEAIGPCDDSAFTLGRGDVLGLQRLY